MGTQTPTVPQIDDEMDLSNSGREIWLVKVPKYIANEWEKAPRDMNVGKLKISHTPGQRAQAQLSLSDSLIALKEPGQMSIPKDHHLEMSDVTNECLGVFSHVAPASTDSGGAELKRFPLKAASTDSGGSELKRFALEGRIVQKLESRPHADDNKYYKFKTESITKAITSQRQSKQTTRVVNFKPVSNHKHNILNQANKKAEVRDDKATVRRKIYAAFKKTRYYTIKDLQRITKQPVGYLKEILKEVCKFNLKNPNKFMWELKRE